MFRKGIGSDSRIGINSYIREQIWGSCFPKDVKALIHTVEKEWLRYAGLKAVEQVNEKQKNVLFEKFNKHFSGDIKGKKVAIWGLSFKPDTDDMREAPSLVLINSLLDNGCEVTVYDPIAMEEAKKILGERVSYAKDIYDSVLDAEAIFHVTEWKEFRLPNWEVIKRSMKPNPVLFDGRNVFDETMLKGIEYIKIG